MAGLADMSSNGFGSHLLFQTTALFFAILFFMDYVFYWVQNYKKSFE